MDKEQIIAMGRTYVDGSDAGILFFANALLNANRKQGADARPANILGPDEDGLPIARYSFQTGIGLVEHSNGTYVRYGEIEQRLRLFKGHEDARLVAWRARGYAQFKTGKPSEWRYYDGSAKPNLNNPECCDIEPLYATRDATPVVDARPVAIYQFFVASQGWIDISKESYEIAERVNSPGNRRIVYATRDAEASDAPKEDAKRLKQLEHALVYVAHSMHSEPQYMLAEGITLGDVSFVRVKVADIDVSVELPESVARAMYDAAMQATATKDEERRIAIAPREKT